MTYDKYIYKYVYDLISLIIKQGLHFVPLHSTWVKICEVTFYTPPELKSYTNNTEDVFVQAYYVRLHAKVMHT